MSGEDERDVISHAAPTSLIYPPVVERTFAVQSPRNTGSRNGASAELYSRCALTNEPSPEACPEPSPLHRRDCPAVDDVLASGDGRSSVRCQECDQLGNFLRP